MIVNYMMKLACLTNLIMVVMMVNLTISITKQGMILVLWTRERIIRKNDTVRILSSFLILVLIFMFLKNPFCYYVLSF
jgi:hypothetical protein